jgi:truncated hemoglobin YjbI
MLPKRFTFMCFSHKLIKFLCEPRSEISLNHSPFISNLQSNFFFVLKCKFLIFKILFFFSFFLFCVFQMSEFAVDNRNVYEEIGHEGFVALSTAFYNRVFEDNEDIQFRSQFEGRAKEMAIQNQYEFFIQRLGGPPLYSQRKCDDQYRGHPALRARHRTFKVNEHNADRWLWHMRHAMEEVGLGNIEEKGSLAEALW